MRELAGLVCAVALLMPDLALAEQPLTYEEALRAAVAANPRIAEARMQQAQVDASVRVALGVYDPLLGLDAAWRQSTQKGFFQGFPFESSSQSWDSGATLQGTLPSGTTWSLRTGLDRNYSKYVTDFGVGENESIQDAYTANTNISLTQQLLEGYRLSYNLQHVTRARRAATVSELSVVRQEQEVLAATAEAYWAWVYAHRLVEILEDAVRVSEEALRVGQLRVEAGDLAPVERTRLEAALVQAQAESIDAANAARQAANTLLLAMGQPPGAEILPATDPGPVPTFDVSTEAATEVALAQNLDLVIARANVETAELERRIAKHALLPSLSATAATGIGAQDDAPGTAISGLFEEDAFPFVAISGQFSVPIGNRAARGELDRSAALLHERELQIADLERTVAAQVQQQVLVLESAQRRVELADLNLRLGEETLAAEEALSEAGRAIQKDVLESRTARDRARAEAAKARTDYRLAQVELLRLQGQLESP